MKLAALYLAFVDALIKAMKDGNRYMKEETKKGHFEAVSVLRDRR